MKSILSLFVFFALGSLAMASDKSRNAQIDDIREAVFRYQIDHHGIEISFLAIGEKQTDPSDDFMERFADHKPPVKKVSASKWDKRTGVADKKTGLHGKIFFTDNVKWLSETEVEVAGGYYEASLSASDNIYTVKKEKGKWTVTKDKLIAVS